MSAAVEAKYRSSDVFVIDVDTEAASVVVYNADAPAKFRIIDVLVIALATAGSGTVKITDGTNDITDAIVAATDKAVTRVGTIDDAYNEIDPDGSLSVVVANAADARVIITCVWTD